MPKNAIKPQLSKSRKTKASVAQQTTKRIKASQACQNEIESKSETHTHTLMIKTWYNQLRFSDSPADLNITNTKHVATEFDAQKVQSNNICTNVEKQKHM